MTDVNFILEMALEYPLYDKPNFEFHFELVKKRKCIDLEYTLFTKIQEQLGKEIVATTHTPERGYKGDVDTLGKPHGKGVEVVANGDCYDGYWVDGCFEGAGKYTTKNGDCYIGSWEKGKMKGKGSLLFANGLIFSGMFENGNAHGLGKIMDRKSNDLFQGNWVNGVLYLEGSSAVRCVSVEQNGDRYNGERVSGKKVGKGVMIFHSGDEYEGDWSNDMIDGNGKYKWKNKAVFTGEFKENKRMGKGVMIYESGYRYLGHWVNDKEHGEGTLINEKLEVVLKGEFKDGYLYQGDVNATGRPHGKGVCMYDGGNVYLGDWNNGKKEGSGKLVLSSGQTFVGEWKDNYKY